MFYSLTLVFCVWIAFDPTHAQGDRDSHPIGGLFSRFAQLRGAIRDRQGDIITSAIKPLTDGRLHPFFPHRQHGLGSRNRENPKEATTTTTVAPTSTSTASQSTPENKPSSTTTSAAPPSTPENKPPSTTTSTTPPSTTSTTTPAASSSTATTSTTTSTTSKPSQEETPSPAVLSAAPMENKPTPSTEDWSQILSAATEADKPKPESITRKIINVPCRGAIARDGSCRQDFD